MTKRLLALALVLVCSRPVAAQTTEQTDLLDKLQANVTALRATYTPASGTIVDVPAGGNLQQVLNAAQPGATIRLTAGAIYTGNFILPAKTCGPGLKSCGVITVTTTVILPNRRIGPADSALLPKLQAPAGGGAALATAAGTHYWTLVGIEFLPNPGGFGDLLQLGDGSSAQKTLASVPHDLIVDRCYLHGDPVTGQKRGIALNSASTTIMRNYISEIHVVGQDSQAIAGWNGPGPYQILDNYLEAASENLLFGGSDPSITNLVPTNITIAANMLTKPLAWRAHADWNVKNLFELKNAKGVGFQGNFVSNVWGPGQGGFAIQLTPRNQDGDCSWCTVEDVQIVNNTFAHMAAAVNILGMDNLHSSARLSRVSIGGNTFDDIDPWAWGGTDKLFQLLAGPVDVTISENATTGQHIGSVLYFDGAPKALRTIFTNNKYPASLYGIFGGGSSAGGNPPHAWVDYVDGGTISGNVVTP